MKTDIPSSTAETMTMHRAYEAFYPESEQVIRIFNALPEHVVYIPIDFDTGDILDSLVQKGFRREEPALFIMESLIMYLSPEKVDEILGGIRQVPGSVLAFDYLPSTLVDGSITAKEGKRMYCRVVRRGEPFLFGLDREALPDFLCGRGFEIIRHLPAPECRHRYFNTTAGTRKISDLFSFVHASVTSAGAP